MGMMMLAWLAIIIVVILALVRGMRPLPPSSTADPDRRLAEQAERIEQLEDELRQVKEQADFTERLLTERSDSPPGDARED